MTDTKKYQISRSGGSSGGGDDRVLLKDLAKGHGDHYQQGPEKGDRNNAGASAASHVHEDAVDDDYCLVYLTFMDYQLHQYDSVKLNFALGRTRWDHIRHNSKDIKELKEKLSSENISIYHLETPSDIISMGYKGKKMSDVRERKAKSDRVENIFRELSLKLQQYCFDIPEPKKQDVFQLLSEKAAAIVTFRFASNGRLVVVASRDNQTDTFQEIKKWLFGFREVKVEKSPADANWEKQYVNLQKQFILLEDPTLKFLLDNKSVQEYVIKELQREVENVVFDFDGKKIDLLGEGVAYVKALDLYHQAVLCQVFYLRESTILRLYGVEEISHLVQLELEKRMSEKFLITTNEEEETLLLVCTNDEVIKQTDIVLAEAKKDVIERWFEFDPKQYENYEQTNWQDIKEATRVSKPNKVEFLPFCNDTKCGIWVIGTKAGVEEFQKNKERLAEDAPLSVDLTDQQWALLQKPQARTYLNQEFLQTDCKVHIDHERRNFKIFCNRDLHAQAISCIWKTLVSRTVEEKDLPCQLTFKELETVIKREPSIDKDKLVVDMDSSTLTLTGTWDVMLKVNDFLSKAKDDYSYLDEEVPMSEEEIKCFEEMGQAALIVMTSKEMKVTYKHIREEGKYGLQIKGAKVGVNRVKSYLSKVQTKAVVSNSKNVNDIDNIENEKDGVDEQESDQKGGGESVFIPPSLTDTPGDQFDLNTGDQSEDDLLRPHVKIMKHEIFEYKSTSQAKYIHPSEIQSQIVNSYTCLSSGSNMSVDDSQYKIKVSGTKDDVVSIIQTIENILDDYAEEILVLELTKEESEHLHPKTVDMKQKMQKDFLLSMDLSSERVTITGPRKNVEECWLHFCKMLTTFAQTQPIFAALHFKMCEENVSDLKKLALVENDHVRRSLFKTFQESGYLFKLVSENRIQLYAGSFSALDKARRVFIKLIHEETFYLSVEPVLRMMSLQDVKAKLLDKSNGKLVVSVEENLGTLHIVCCSDMLQNVEDHLQKIKDMFKEDDLQAEFDSDILKQIDFHNLEERVMKLEPNLKGKFKVVYEGGMLTVVAQPDFLDLAKMRVKVFLVWKQKELKVFSKIPSIKMRLTKECIELMLKPEVVNYIDKQMKPFPFTIDMDTRDVKIYAITHDLLEEGKTTLLSCFEARTLVVKKEPVGENLDVLHIKDMLEAQEIHHKGKLIVVPHVGRQELKVICTNDVTEIIVTKFNEIKESCSEVTDCLEKMTWEEVITLRKLFPEEFQKIEKRVTVKNGFESTTEVTGKRSDVDNFKKELQKLKQETFESIFLSPGLEEALKTTVGEEIIAEVQNEIGCLITRSDHGTVLTQDETDQDLASLQTSLKSHHYVRLSNWTSECGSSITIIQGSLNEVRVDILAVPVVSGLPPTEVMALVKNGPSTDYDWMKTQLDKMKGNPKEKMIDLGHTKWSHCGRVILFWMPDAINEGKNQEKQTVRKTVQDILQMLLDQETASCAFILGNLKDISQRSVKHIISGVQEAFKELQNCCDVFLVSDEYNNTELMKILEKACPDSKKFNIQEQIKKKMKKRKNKAIWNMKPPAQFKQAVDTAKDNDDTVKLVVYARTDKDCKRAIELLQKEISKMSELHKKEMMFLECPVCVKHFNQTDRRPCILHSCLHAFCTQCLHQLLVKEGKGQITCPLCRQVQRVKGKVDTLPLDPVRDKLVTCSKIKENQQVLCGECEKNYAISRCQDCQSNLCTECDFVHKRHRVSKDHSIISLDEAQNLPVKSLSKGHFCLSHPKHQFEFYCATEDQLCCVACVAYDHKGHDLQKLEKAATTKQQETEITLEGAHFIANRLKEAKIEDARQEKIILEAKKKSLSDINMLFDNLAKVLDDRKRQLKAAVNEKSSNFLSAVEKTKAANDQTLAIVESTDTYFTQAKEKADVVEMLQMYPAIKRSVQDLQQPQTIPRFAEHVTDFRFQKHKSDEVMTFVTDLGAFGTPTKGGM